jgi:quercetin dioxygenase-like cupin family protein
LTKPAIVRTSRDGTTNQAFGLPRQFKIEKQDSDGAFSVFIEEVPGQAGPPMHIHHGQYETFLILQGDVRFHCDGEETELGAGGLITIPPGAPHTFKNVGDGTARIAITMVPGGLEGFFKAVEEERLEPPKDMARIAEIAADYGLEFVGPPLG